VVSFRKDRPRSLCVHNVSTMLVYNNPSCAKGIAGFPSDVAGSGPSFPSHATAGSPTSRISRATRGTRKWGDPVYTLFRGSLRLAEKMKDREWLDVLDQSIAAIG